MPHKNKKELKAALNDNTLRIKGSYEPKKDAEPYILDKTGYYRLVITKEGSRDYSVSNDGILLENKR
tara:strand:- start:127 stop:327 length:201 start_codon:yes stop_codon:yes gene_type:complete